MKSHPGIYIYISYHIQFDLEGAKSNIFDKVFRRTYSDDIDRFVTEEAPGEYKALFGEIQEKYFDVTGHLHYSATLNCKIGR